jgi:predicted lysophospholipase L1 biosynthesis ABC-type transport system permease subunit
VALITDSLARRYFAGKDPIGKQIQFGNMDGDLHLLTIIGVVGDVRDRALEAEPHPTVYVHYAQRAMRAGEFTFVLKGRADLATLIKSMRQQAMNADPQMPVKFLTIDQVISSSLDNRRFGLVMVGGFAGAALLLAMVGLYGIMAYITAERTTEVGIRMALGAQRGNILRLILGQSFAMVAVGAIAGLLLALGTNRFLGTLLYGVSPTDPRTYATVVLLLGLVAFVATYIPARRATRIEPILALRHE